MAGAEVMTMVRNFDIRRVNNTFYYIEEEVGPPGRDSHDSQDARCSSRWLAVAAIAFAPAAAPRAGPAAVVTVKNPLDLARPSETIVLDGRRDQRRRCRWRTCGRCTSPTTPPARKCWRSRST